MGRKAKTAPASSAKALELCGDTSKLGVSAADIFAQYGAGDDAYAVRSSSAAEDDGAVAASVSDAELSMALHALQKKDPTTRLRGATDLQKLMGNRDVEILKEVCGPFLHIYRRLWPQDAEPRVREVLQRCLQTLVEVMQRDFQRHLRGAFPTWLCAMFDTHPEVAHAARKAFTAAFTSEDRRSGVFRLCQLECLTLITANLRHSEQSLHDELGISATAAASGDRNTALERQDRYIRVIVATLGGLGELVHICSTGPPPQPNATSSSAITMALNTEAIAPLFVTSSGCALWPRLSAKQPPLIRRSAAECLARILHAPSVSQNCSCATSAVRSTVLNTLADEAIPPVIAIVLVYCFATAGGDECWEGLVANKSLWPQMLAAVNRGAASDIKFLTKLPLLLKTLPGSSWGPGRGESLLRALLEAFKTPRAPAAEIWRIYFAVVRIADDAGSPVDASWRWAPVQLFLGFDASQYANASDGSDAASGKFCPPCRVPVAGLNVLPSVFEQELVQLLAHDEFGRQLLSTLAAGAPQLPESNIQEDSAAETCKALADSWRSWLTMFAIILMENMLKAEALRNDASEILVAQFQRVLAFAMHVHLPRDASNAMLVCEILGGFLGNEKIQPQHTWGVELAGAAEALPRVASKEDGWPPEAALLAWPLLPLLRRWTFEDSGGKTPTCLGTSVLRPLLRVAIKRLGKEHFPTEQVRDLILSQGVGTILSDVSNAHALGTIIKLMLECMPNEMNISGSSVFQQHVKRVAELSAEGDGLGDDALRLALSPGILPPWHLLECIKVLASRLDKIALSAIESRPCVDSLRLALILGDALSKYDSSDSDVSQSVREFREPVSVAFLRALIGNAGSEDAVRDLVVNEDIWTQLSVLLQGVDTNVVYRTIGSPPRSAAARNHWTRAVLTVSAANGIRPMTVAYSCRGLSCDRPHVRYPDLFCNALATADLFARRADMEEDATPFSRLLITENCEDIESPDVRLQMFLLWELLLAAALRTDYSEKITFAKAASLAKLAWDWLTIAEPTLRGIFVTYCMTEASEENQTWHVCEGISELPLPKSSGTTSLRLHGLAVFRSVLENVWLDAESARLSRASEVLRSALAEAKEERQDDSAWGEVCAAIISRCAKVDGTTAGVSLGLSIGAIRAEWRDRLRSVGTTATTSNAVRLRAAAAIETWAYTNGHTTSSTSPSVIVRPSVTDAEPLITEVVASEGRSIPDAAAAAENMCDNIDTGLIETNERLLRWAQIRGTVEARDSFAVYVAAVWTDLAASIQAANNPTATRMHRMVLELMADVKKDTTVNVSAGALKLASALCSTDNWPNSSWPSLFQALSDVESLLTQNVSASSAFKDNVVDAANEILRYAPSASIAKVVPLLASIDTKIQEAAVARLHLHKWVPEQLESVQGPSSNILKRMETILQESEDGVDVTSQTQNASCNDVVYAVLDATVGSELTQELWSIEVALGSFLEWVADINLEPESSADEEELSSGKKVNEKSTTNTNNAHIKSHSSDMPQDCRRCCVAALAAWELLLLGLQTWLPHVAGSNDKAGSAANQDGVSTLPSELLAMALQLSPDQLAGAGTASQGWKRAPKQMQNGVSPLHPLLKLLVNVLTCDRFFDGEGIEHALTLALQPGQSPNPDCSVFALAGRVLLLALKIVPASVRVFWEQLPRRKDREIVEQLIVRNFSPILVQGEATASSAQLDAQREKLEDIEAAVVKRPKVLVLQLSREDVKTELEVKIPDSFPLKIATAEPPEKMPGIPKDRVRKWMLQARQALAGTRPRPVGRVMLMWARSFALFFEGVEDCPICYNVVHLSTQTIPRKPCPTCKHKFHSECLYHWFKTSAKTTCPLCNQPF